MNASKVWSNLIEQRERRTLCSVIYTPATIQKPRPKGPADISYKGHCQCYTAEWTRQDGLEGHVGCCDCSLSPQVSSLELSSKTSSYKGRGWMRVDENVVKLQLVGSENQKGESCIGKKGSQLPLQLSRLDCLRVQPYHMLQQNGGHSCRKQKR